MHNQRAAYKVFALSLATSMALLLFVPTNGHAQSTPGTTTIPAIPSSAPLVLIPGVQNTEASADPVVIGNPANSLVTGSLRGTQTTAGPNGSSPAGRISTTPAGNAVAPLGPRSNRIGNGAGNNADSGNSYDPEPLRVGRFNVSGELAVTGGASTNLTSAAGGTDGRFSRAQFSGSAKSDWTRHQLRLSSSADVDLFNSGSVNRDVSINLQAETRLDLTQGNTLTLNSGVVFATEDANSPDAAVTGTDNPIVSTYTLGATYDRDVGIVGLQLRGGLEATRYAPVEIAGQPAQSQDTRNQNVGSLGARLSYDKGGKWQPYIDASLARGDRTVRLDANGFDRRYLLGSLLAGAVFEVWDGLRCNVEACYTMRVFADTRLDDLSGLTANANLQYNPTDDLSISASLGTSFSGSSQNGASGSIAYDAGANLVWSLRDNLELTASSNFVFTDYSNDERDAQLDLSLGANYWITPHAGVTAEVSRTNLTTNRVGAA